MATITKFMGNKRVAFGTASVTGSATVATGLESVDVVLVSSKSDLDGAPAAVSAAPSATAGSIGIRFG